MHCTLWFCISSYLHASIGYFCEFDDGLMIRIAWRSLQSDYVVYSCCRFQSEIHLVKFRNRGIIPRTLDIMELNTTKYYDGDSDPDNNDVHVLASKFLTYKVGKLYSSHLSSNLLSFWWISKICLTWIFLKQNKLQMNNDKTVTIKSIKMIPSLIIPTILHI